MKQTIYDSLSANPIVAAVKSESDIKKVCGTPEVGVAFILYGDICSIGDIVEKFKQASKIVFVHIDLITGLASKEIAVDFIKNFTKADGVISTKPSLLKRAKELSLCTVLRVFPLDSLAIKNIAKQYCTVDPDLVEVLPGIAPKLIRNVKKIFHTHVIAGGFITDKEEVMAALEAGALAVSSSNPSVWKF